MQQTAYELKVRGIKKKIIVNLRIATSVLYWEVQSAYRFSLQDQLNFDFSQWNSEMQATINRGTNKTHERATPGRESPTYRVSVHGPVRLWRYDIFKFSVVGDYLWFLMVGFVFYFLFLQLWNMIRQLHFIST